MGASQKALDEARFLPSAWVQVIPDGPLAACGDGAVRRRCNEHVREGWRAGVCVDDCPCNGKVTVDAKEVGRQAYDPRFCSGRTVVLTWPEGPGRVGHVAQAASNGNRARTVLVTAGGAALPRRGVLPFTVLAVAAVTGHRAVTRFFPCSVGFFSAELGIPRRYRGRTC